MRHPASSKLHAHWDALRAGRACPGRDEIDFAAIRDALASAFLLVVPPRPAEATFSLSGTRLDALFGRPLRGTAFRRIWSARCATVGSALEFGSGRPGPAMAVARGAPPALDPVEFELLLLPLDGGRQVLGSLAPFSAPRWMGLAAAAPLDLPPPGLAPLDIRRARDPGCFGRRPTPAPHPPAVRGAMRADAGP